ncbi:MAG TPA: TRAP transporter substrate-binding protein DctP [Gemmatimonadaceae bacterium]|nr:TRAP transporter substrate-binding protein DctP [Gemmatimonadaceae bacterium]
MKRPFSSAAVVSAFAFATVLASGNALAQQPVVLKGITPWTADYDLSRGFFTFQELVNGKLKGKLAISYLGGPEVAAPNQQFQALKNGVVDVMLGAAAYYRTEVPLAWAVQFAQKTPPELRKSGYFDLMRKIHLEQGGVVYLANTAAGGGAFRLYIDKKIAKPDLKGLKIRVSPVYTPLVNALGGAPISMAPGEIFTGMERRVVDGFGWTYTGIDLFGLHEVTKYVIDHPFYSLDTVVLMNKSVYDRLSPEIQKTLAEVCEELERRHVAYMQDRLKKEDEKLKRLGMDFIRFSPADAERYVRTAYEAGWKDFAEKNAASLKANPGLLEQLQKLGS